MRANRNIRNPEIVFGRLAYLADLSIVFRVAAVVRKTIRQTRTDRERQTRRSV